MSFSGKYEVETQENYEPFMQTIGKKMHYWTYLEDMVMRWAQLAFFLFYTTMHVDAEEERE